MSSANVFLITCLVLVLFIAFADRRRSNQERRKVNLFPGYSTLQPSERELLNHFFVLPTTDLWVGSVWQLAIRKVCVEQGATEFRALCAQLRSQALDAPDTIVSIIGLDAYDLLVHLPERPQTKVIRMAGVNDSAVHDSWGEDEPFIDDSEG